MLNWLSVDKEVTSNLRGQAAANRQMLKGIYSGDRFRIACTAQELYSAGGGQTVRMHFPSNGTDEAERMQAVTERVVAA